MHAEEDVVRTLPSGARVRMVPVERFLAALP
jgi:hypothetical protein